MMDLSSVYMGLSLRNPLVASASPLSHTLDGVRRLADAGVGAVVLHSLFEEELERDSERYLRLLDAGSESFAESLSYFPGAPMADAGPVQYLNLLERASSSVDVPVIASLNGTSLGGWTRYARSLRDAGAAAVELNLYHHPGGAGIPGRVVEERQLEVLREVKAAVGAPLAVKISPFYSSIGEMAGRLDEAGADGVVMFNRFIHPDIDVERVEVVPGIGLSGPEEARLPRVWIALLRGRLRASIAASTGVDGPADVASYLLAGADVVMTASALLRHGPGYATTLIEGLVEWMRRKGFETISDLRGILAVPASADQAQHERARYVTALRSANASSQGPW